ncbi:hypothetical protein U0070_027189 [Myodes glareolus]|uniref:Ig-like domain-containing protein n=1 Tax=Myodes glareolus TaxID=447135 RepID=A0AAW0HT69_MYOGA
MVSGQEWGSLTVRCRYHSKWKTNKKHWCRGTDWSKCEIPVKTDMEQLMKKDRVSTRDDQTDFVITVTMEELRISDAGVYWCGIQKQAYDPTFKVNVNIDPVMMLDRAIWVKNVAETKVKREPILVAPQACPYLAFEGWTRNTRKTETSMPGDFLLSVSFVSLRSLLSSIYFKILVFLELPLFLSMLSAVLWVNRPQRCSGGGEVGLRKVQSSDAAYREKNFHAERK